ncbi:MAG: hypothetical protein IT462_15215 [Planctomycetes bacterium]|nr:hypothetical protein [Planctomycetota bacterium]
MARKAVVLTAKQVAEYLTHKGLHCPWCGSEWLDPSGHTFEENDVVVPVQCCTCRRHWKDVYRLADIVIP